MKIIIVEHRFHYSGPVAQRLLGYARYFVSQGCEVVMILSAQTSLPTQENGVRFIEIKEQKNRMIRCYFEFVHTIKREYSQNSILFFYENGIYSFLFRFPKYNVFAEQTEIPSYGFTPTLKQFFVEKIRFYAVKHFSGLVVISEALRKYYTQMGVNNIEVINMFVDSSRFNNITIESEEPYIVYCGTISTHKDGVDTLLKAYYQYHCKFPNVKLYLVGDFENDIVKNEILYIIKVNNLDSVVVLKGRINADQMPSLLSGAHMLVLARPQNTQTQYGFPTKLGEYLATGKPVVVTKVGDIPLFLTDKVNAFLSEPNDEVDFAKKMVWVTENYEEALKVGNQGKSLVDNEFSSITQGAKALAFFKRITMK